MTLAPIASAVAFLVVASIPKRSLPSDDPLPRLEYEINEISDYFAQRPVAVATRSVVVAAEALRWGLGKYSSLEQQSHGRNIGRRLLIRNPMELWNSNVVISSLLDWESEVPPYILALPYRYMCTHRFPPQYSFKHRFTVCRQGRPLF